MDKLSRIPVGYAALGVLIAWGAALLTLGLLRQSVIGIDEGAAKDLLLLWSISDRVASPVGTFGAPDLRAILYIPPAIYWPGSITAAKVFTLMLMFGAIYLLFKWNHTKNNESSLIASALLLICPITITQIDTLSPGPYLVLCVALAYWLDNRYISKGRHLGGWYFVQLIVVALAVSMHPIGLAYPLALAYIWATRDTEQGKERKKSIFIGVAIASALITAFRMGWQDNIAWFSNPLQTLADAIQNGYSQLAEPGNLAIGAIALAVLCLVIFYDRKFLTKNISGCFLLFGTIIGLVAADGSWALFATTLVLYRGAHLLINFNDSFKSETLIAKRGIVIVLGFILTTSFMTIDRQYANHLTMEMHTPSDELIRNLCDRANTLPEEAPFKAASEWPARTMIACRRDVFPLPAAAENGPALLERIQGITHLIFNHNTEENKGLARNIADLPGVTKTLAIQPGGVIIHIPSQSSADSQPSELTIPHKLPETETNESS